VYYGLYTQDGASVSKKPIDTKEPWVSRIDLNLLRPLCVASLVRLITLNEGINSTSSQIFADQNTMVPLCDDHILMKDGNWPGSTADDYVTFKFVPRCTVNGSRYRVQNCSTGRIMEMGQERLLVRGPNCLPTLPHYQVT